MFGLFKSKKKEPKKTIRPLSLDDYRGQDNAKTLINIAIQGAKTRKESLEHVVIYGPPGLGKTTLARIIANEMGAHMHSTIGTAIQKPDDLLQVFQTVLHGDILFIDEIHRIPIKVEELLYTAMEDGYIDTKNQRIRLPEFTLIGATTRVGDLSAPLRDRFAHQLKLDYYAPQDLATIAKRTAQILGTTITSEAANIFAQCSRGTPRIINNFIKKARDVAAVANVEIIDSTVAYATLDLLGIDMMGLDEVDRRILSVLIDDFKGNPVGLNTLATCVGENAKTIQEVYEPYLIYTKLIQPTSRGRVATELAHQHLNG